MTRQDIENFARQSPEVQQAFWVGKTIQAYTINADGQAEWNDCDKNILFDLESWQYRVKPDEPAAPVLDPNEAPEGYVAKLAIPDDHPCHVCAISTYIDGTHACVHNPCMADERKDGCDVYFTRKPKPASAYRPWKLKTKQIVDRRSETDHRAVCRQERECNHEHN